MKINLTIATSVLNPLNKKVSCRSTCVHIPEKDLIIANTANSRFEMLLPFQGMCEYLLEGSLTAVVTVGSRLDDRIT